MGFNACLILLVHGGTAKTRLHCSRISHCSQVKDTTLNWSRFRTAMGVGFDHARGWCARRELTVGDQVL